MRYFRQKREFVPAAVLLSSPNPSKIQLSHLAALCFVLYCRSFPVVPNLPIFRPSPKGRPIPKAGPQLQVQKNLKFRFLGTRVLLIAVPHRNFYCLIALTVLALRGYNAGNKGARSLYVRSTHRCRLGNGTRSWATGQARKLRICCGFCCLDGSRSLLVRPCSVEMGLRWRGVSWGVALGGLLPKLGAGHLFSTLQIAGYVFLKPQSKVWVLFFSWICTVRIPRFVGIIGVMVLTHSHERPLCGACQALVSCDPGNRGGALEHRLVVFGGSSAICA